MSLTTPSLPAELPPYSFVPLLSPVYHSSTSFAPLRDEQRPTSPSFGSSLGRIGQFVSGASSSSNEPTKPAVLRAVDASGNQCWIASSDGRIRSYEANEAHGDHKKDSVIESLELLEEHTLSTARKSIDKLHIATSKAVVLSEGQLTFHALPSFAPLPTSSFPTVKGVITFAVDEDASQNSSQSFRLCVVKRRSLHIFQVRKDGASLVKDLPLLNGATALAFRRGHVCLADAENYSIVDIAAATAIPLMPITQTAEEADELDEEGAEGKKSVNSHHRPAIVCVGTNEFLFASHTGPTTLGVFVNEAGEPCRGTLEWASNVRSLTTDGPYTIALLHNDSIEVHSLQTQEIVQVVSLSAIELPTPMQPRSLTRTTRGLEVGSATVGSKIVPVEVSLSPSPSMMDSAQSQNVRSRPTRSASVASSAVSDIARKKQDARVLLLCRNGLHALAPSTLIAQVEAFFAKDRVDEAVKLAEQADECNEAEPAEMRYVYVRATYGMLKMTFCQTAFGFFFKSRCDPRILIRMFPRLAGGLIGPDDTADVPRGVRDLVSAGRTIDDFVTENLKHGYSPQVKKEVESADSDAELEKSLKSTARDCLQSYLSQWHKLRRDEGIAVTTDPEASHRIDQAVDTVLAKLLVERGMNIDLLRLLEGPNDCVLDEIEPALVKAGMYHTVASTRLKRGDLGRALEIWTKIIDGEYVDSLFSGGASDVFEHLVSTEDQALVEKYGLWLLEKDRDLALRLLTDSKQAGKIDTRRLFDKMKDVDAEAADTFLESIVLQKKSTDATLLNELIKRYMDRLSELLQDEASKAHIRETETQYSQSEDRSEAFLEHLVARYSPDSATSTVDRVRLKAALFLSSTNAYDLAAVKNQLEDLEKQGCRGLTLERVIVYGKSNLDRQALSLLLFHLRDMRSVEAFVHQSGNPLLPADVNKALSKLQLTMPSPSKKATRIERPARRRELARIVVDLTLARLKNSESAGQDDSESASHVLNAYSLHTDSLEVLKDVPDAWPVHRLVGFFERSLQRSLLAQQEAGLLKTLASSQNLELSERLFEKQRKMGPRVERKPDSTTKTGPPPTSETRTPAGTRRKSSVVKIETPLAFKDEGEVLEL